MATRLLRLRYPATCSCCGSPIAVGSRGWWDSQRRSAACTACRPASEDEPVTTLSRPTSTPTEDLPTFPTSGTAGGSARREYDRRHQRRIGRIDQEWGRLAGVVKFLSHDPQSTKAWAKGSEGERKLAEYLSRAVGERAVLLHDRRIPRSRANIDHLVVAASGIWIVDAKSYKGRIELRDVGGWMRTDRRLYVNGRDQSQLLSGLTGQIDAVLTATEEADIPVNVALCFVDSEWSLFAKPFELGGVLVTWPRRLSEAIAAPGPLSRDDVLQVAGRLAVSLPEATPASG